MSTDAPAPVAADASIELHNDGIKAVAWAKTFAIADDYDYALAGRVLIEIKKRLNAVKDYWKPMKQAADKAKREILDKEQAMAARFEDAGKMVDAAVLAYNRMLQAKAADAQRAADEIARKAAEAKRAEEAKAAAELAAIRAAQVAEALAACDRLKAERAAALAKQEAEAAKVAAAAPLVVNAVAVAAPVAPKVAGLSFRTEHKCECTNELIVPVEYKSVDMKKVSAAVEAAKGGSPSPAFGFGLNK